MVAYAPRNKQKGHDVTVNQINSNSTRITQENVQEWIDSCTQSDGRVWNSTQSLLNSFESYLDVPVSSNVFGKRLAEMNFHSTKRYVNNKQERGFVGIRLNGSDGGQKRKWNQEGRQLVEHGVRHVRGPSELGEPAKQRRRQQSETTEPLSKDAESGLGEEALKEAQEAVSRGSVKQEAREKEWRAQLGALEADLKEAQEAAPREAAKQEASEREWRTKSDALEGALKEAREAASREAAKHEAREAEWKSKTEALGDALGRVWEALAEGEAREEAQRAKTVALEETLKEIRVAARQEQEATQCGWRTKTDALVEALKQVKAKVQAREAAWQSKMCALETSLKGALADNLTAEVAWRARIAAVQKALKEAQGAASQALAREGVLKALYDAATEASVRMLRKGEDVWKYRYDRLERDYSETQARESALREEKDHIEKELLAYSLCGIRGNPGDRVLH